MQRPLVIYHGGCSDGFGAAYALYARFCRGGECSCDFVAGVHGQPPPDVSGREVHIVDFSYKRPVLEQICRSARSVLIIDHHISAERNLQGLEREYDNLQVIFDMNKSGAVLAWEHYHSTPPPRLLLHIQDRDLWRFQMEGTNDIHAALVSRPFDFRDWEKLCAGDEALEPLLKEGRAINRYRWRMIELHREKAVMATISGYRVPLVNCYEDIMSDLVGELAEGQPFAAGYQDQGTIRKWSLRSREGGIDVSEIASRLGGGGHRNAAGFNTNLPEELLVIP